MNEGEDCSKKKSCNST